MATGLVRHTRHDITCVHSIFVLDEAEAVHKLDLGDLASAMGVEVVLNIGLGSYSARGPVSEFRRGECRPSSPGSSSDSDGPMPGECTARECRVARRVKVRQKRGAGDVQRQVEGSENVGQPCPHPRILGMQRQHVLPCATVPTQGKKRTGSHIGRAQRSVPLRGRLPR